MTKQIIILSALLFLVSKTNACSCINAPEYFAENIKANHIIIAAKVLEHIPIPSDSNTLVTYHGLTKLKVTRWFQNQMHSDTIYYANGHASMCTSSIANLSIGDHVIIKALEENISDVAFELNQKSNSRLVEFIDRFKTKPTIAYGICDVGVLQVKDSKVTGSITKNHQQRRWRLIKLVRRISQKWADKLHDKRISAEPKYQTWSFEKFSKLMKRKWNAL